MTINRLIQNEMILASAGAGKTYALAVRFIRIIAHGADPERVLALTFTRRAASEFQQAILLRLARAADDKDSARRLAEETGCRLNRIEFGSLLKKVVSALDRLTLTTIDSFFARVVQCFSFELRLLSSGIIMDDHHALIARMETYRKLFSITDPDTRKRFYQHFKQATFGREEKSLIRYLDRFVRDHHALLLGHPDPKLWGHAPGIFPNGSVFLNGRWDLEKEALALHRALDWSGFSEKRRDRWIHFFEALERWSPGGPLPGPVKYIFTRAGKEWEALRNGNAAICVERTAQQLSPSACEHLRNILCIWIQAEIVRSITTSQGVQRLLAAYEQTYADAIRNSGHLTFADLPLLLLGRWESNDPVIQLSQMVDSGPSRIRIDYRLDGQFDHWMLDEFQDTSRLQWSVIENLVDEVMQDTSGQRSFFYVGDVKQGIYAWRGGDSRLFKQVRERYTGNDNGGIQIGHLDRSWRCSAPILSAVNRVFGDALTLDHLFPKAAAERWLQDWRTHETAHPERPGCAALWSIKEQDQRFRAMADIIREADPIGRGLTCAVLLRKNDSAWAAVDFLRAEGIPAARDGRIEPGRDNFVGLAVQALLSSVLHPGDTFSWHYLLMTPLGTEIKKTGVSRSELSDRFLRVVAQSGVEAALQPWISSFARSDDLFTADRARRILSAAREFDSRGAYQPRQFIHFLNGYSIPESVSSDTIQVMTIHKSKGLTFDMVILPEFGSDALTTATETISVSRDPTGEAQWILPLPTQDVCGLVPELAEYQRQRAADIAFEAFCVLYVAMTRARFALHVLCEPPSEKGEKADYRTWLHSAWGTKSTKIMRIGDNEYPCVALEGDPEWWSSFNRKEADSAEPEEAAPIPATIESATDRHMSRVLPSRHAFERISGCSLFDPDRRRAMQQGRRIHAWLSQLSWRDDITNDRLTGWENECLKSEMESWILVRDALQTENVAVCFERPTAPSCDLWREKPFEMIWQGNWVSGVFDRVVIERAGDGRACRATLYDFKTDQGNATTIDTLALRYEKQLRIYRDAVMRLTGVTASFVTCNLVFLSIGRCVRCFEPSKECENA